MGIVVVNGTGHGDQNLSHDVPDNGEDLVLGSATEIDRHGNPTTGTATVWVSNLWTEIVPTLQGNVRRIHFRVRADWASDINWRATLVHFKHPGGPFG